MADQFPKWKSKYSREDLVQRKFSGVALNLPEDFKLVLVDVSTNRRFEFKDTSLWMRRSMLRYMADYELGVLEGKWEE